MKLIIPRGLGSSIWSLINMKRTMHSCAWQKNRKVRKIYGYGSRTNNFYLKLLAMDLNGKSVVQAWLIRVDSFGNSLGPEKESFLKIAQLKAREQFNCENKLDKPRILFVLVELFLSFNQTSRNFLPEYIYFLPNCIFLITYLINSMLLSQSIN